MRFNNSIRVNRSNYKIEIWMDKAYVLMHLSVLLKWSNLSIMVPVAHYVRKGRR